MTHVLGLLSVYLVTHKEQSEEDPSYLSVEYLPWADGPLLSLHLVGGNTSSQVKTWLPGEKAAALQCLAGCLEL